MKVRTLIAIHCHHGVEDVIERHEPFWRAHGHDFVYLCPQDRPITNRPHLSAGFQGHAGPVSIDRFRRAWKLLEHLEYDRYVIFEYDSLCISGDLPETLSGLWGNRFENEDSRFKAKRYFHAPWILTLRTLSSLNAIMHVMPSNTEGGYFDRFLGYALETSKIPGNDLKEAGFGYSQNTIDERFYEGMQKAILNGATCLHGVKSKECLSLALIQRENFMRSKIVMDNIHRSQPAACA